MRKPQIVLTNDDGFDSPGLWAAANTLSELGEVWVTAPRDQFSGAGATFVRGTDCKIEERESKIHGKGIHAFAIGASPAQTVYHAVKEILHGKPDLVVSGINYGENLGALIYGSGTVGAAISAAILGIPAIAASLQIPAEEGYLSYSERVDFRFAAEQTVKWATHFLDGSMPKGFEILKLDVPQNAGQKTEWQWTTLSACSYFDLAVDRSDPEQTHICWSPMKDLSMVEKGSDIDILINEHKISACPMQISPKTIIDTAGFQL